MGHHLTINSEGTTATCACGWNWTVPDATIGLGVLLPDRQAWRYGYLQAAFEFHCAQAVCDRMDGRREIPVRIMRAEKMEVKDENSLNISHFPPARVRQIRTKPVWNITLQVTCDAPLGADNLSVLIQH